MPLRLRILLGILLLTIFAAALQKYGGPFWRPVVSAMRGENTVGGTLANLQSKGKGFSDAEAKRATSITLLGLKEERVLEVWLHPAEGNPEKIREYPFTGFSGEIGPKLREGDLQIPEGIYEIEYLNPNSDYHLSIKLDYPNAFDREKAALENRMHPGTNIFLHGGSSTIGCIPIGDDKIEDLFAIVAQIGKEQVSAILSPRDFRKQKRDPLIPSIDWEDELYSGIRAAMQTLR